MKKRDFIKTGMLGVVGLSTLRLKANNSVFLTKNTVFNIPQLPYRPSDISYFVSEYSFNAHYNNQYKSLNNKLNKSLANVVFKPKAVKDILISPNQYSSDVVENACGYYNHKLFFKLISPINRNASKNKLTAEIEKQFGSIENFKVKFKELVLKENKKGWAWLVLSRSQLKIVFTQNNFNPLMPTVPKNIHGFPVIGLDLWPHSYNSNYGVDKVKYTDAFLSSINWQYANKRYFRALNQSRI